MAEFFIAPELDWIPEETDMGPYLKAFGYDYKFVTYFEVIYDGKPMDGEDFCELYSENPSELDKLAMPPQTDSEGYRLAMFVDSEDGLCGLYVKPVSGAALLLEERRQRIRAINSR